MKDSLQHFVEKHDLTNRSWEAFWQTYDSYISEQPEESASVGLIDRNSVNAVMDCVFFKTYMLEQRSEVVVRVEMFNTADKNIGYFDCVFDEVGSNTDYFFVID